MQTSLGVPRRNADMDMSLVVLVLDSPATLQRTSNEKNHNVQASSEEQTLVPHHHSERVYTVQYSWLGYKQLRSRA